MVGPNDLPLRIEQQGRNVDVVDHVAGGGIVLAEDIVQGRFHRPAIGGKPAHPHKEENQRQ